MRDLAQTIQTLYDSEINVTITMLWDGGIDFALCSSMQMCEDSVEWQNVSRVNQLADAIHYAVLRKYPRSTYAGGPGYGDENGNPR